MRRTILAVIGGLVAWTLAATLIDIGLRLVLPGYREAEPALAFTLIMMIARLTLAVIASLAAGIAARAIAPASNLAPWLIGLIALAIFLPEHIRIGARLPLWYHAFFLITLAPLVALGARGCGCGVGVMPARMEQRLRFDGGWFGLTASQIFDTGDGGISLNRLM